jgi:hypothetical protein
MIVVHYFLTKCLNDIKDNNMKTFKDLVFKQHSMRIGIHAIMEFKNGYGISVVQTPYSYGGKMGLYEIAVIDKEGEVVYNTPIAEGVIGYLREEDVTQAMERIQLFESLPF